MLAEYIKRQAVFLVQLQVWASERNNVWGVAAVEGVRNAGFIVVLVLALVVLDEEVVNVNVFNVLMFEIFWVVVGYLDQSKQMMMMLLILNYVT